MTTAITSEPENWIVILVCDNVPNQKFWDGADWTRDLDKAKKYPTYGRAAECIWREISQENLEREQKLADKANPGVGIRVTSSPIHLYRKLLAGKEA